MILLNNIRLFPLPIYKLLLNISKYFSAPGAAAKNTYLPRTLFFASSNNCTDSGAYPSKSFILVLIRSSIALEISAVCVSLFALIRRTSSDELKKSVPGAHIFVNAIFPVQEKAVKEKPVFAEIENFNEKLKELCDKKRIAFIDSSDLMSDEYYEQDGIHFNAVPS